MTHETARMIAVRNGYREDLIDRVDPNLPCPGFRLWHVTIDGEDYLVTADDEASALARACFRSRVTSDRITVHGEVGLNPDRETWEREWTALHYPTA